MFLLKLNPIEPPWYGPVCPVVWEGRHREGSPYPDLWHLTDVSARPEAKATAEQGIKSIEQGADRGARVEARPPARRRGDGFGRGPVECGGRCRGQRGLGHCRLAAVGGS